MGALLAVGLTVAAFGGSPTAAAEIGQTSQSVASNNTYALVSVQVGARVVPQGPLAVTIVVRNTGNTTWQSGHVVLRFQGVGAWTDADLTLGARVRPGQNATFTGAIGAPAQIGLFGLAWQAMADGVPFGDPIRGSTEVTCSDGVFCNGDERWVNGRCAAGTPPCDDRQTCTTDTCEERTGVCAHTLGASCAACFAKNCNPNCRGAVCGDDGCGGSCGGCAFGQACLNGACAPATQPGSCSNPLPLIQPGESLLGKHVLTGDTSSGVNEVWPTCNSSSTAPEKIYTFTVGVNDGSVGIDARSHDFDTVLHLRKASCTDPKATIGCSDDAAPPGDYGSRVALLLAPGTYYLIVDGFDGNSVGPYTLTVTFAANCVPACDGRYCGSTDGCGGDCGVCTQGSVCNTSGRCVKSPCTADCNGRKCGDDGCGGTCGTCDKGQLCVTATGACKSFAVCDHDRPSCKTACSSTEFCGSDCACHRRRDVLPDLVVNRKRLGDEILFDEKSFSDASCAVAESCVNGPGLRKLLRFSVEAINQGQTTLTVPAPADRPDLFEWSPCHGHYHFKGFASYALLDMNGNVVVRGKKLAYCMEDTVQAIVGPQVACAKKYDCGNQGIQAGWSDLYGNALDCQWLDITGVPSGTYQLSVTVNPSRLFEEMSFDNNTSVVNVTIP